MAASSRCRRCRRLPSPVRSSVRAWWRLSRRRSITVSPARAMPVSTVTIVSSTAASWTSANCPTVCSVRAVVANARIAVSTTGLNSGPGSCRFASSQAAPASRTAAAGAASSPAPRSASPASAARTGMAGLQRARAIVPAEPPAAVAAAGGAPSAKASAAIEEAPIAASSHERRVTPEWRSSTSSAAPAVARTQPARESAPVAESLRTAAAEQARAAANRTRGRRPRSRMTALEAHTTDPLMSIAPAAHSRSTPRSSRRCVESATPAAPRAPPEGARGVASAPELDDELIGLRAHDELAARRAVFARAAGDRGRLLVRGGHERPRHRDRAVLELERARALEGARERAAGDVDQRADLAQVAGRRARLVQDAVAGDHDVAGGGTGLARVHEGGLDGLAGLGQADRVAVVRGAGRAGVCGAGQGQDGDRERRAGDAAQERAGHGELLGEGREGRGAEGT